MKEDGGTRRSAVGADCRGAGATQSRAWGLAEGGGAGHGEIRGTRGARARE